MGRTRNIRPNITGDAARGRGRLQVAVRRAFIVHGPVVTTMQVYDFAYAGRRKYMRASALNKRRIWQLLSRVADRVGRAPLQGAPWIWRLKSETDLPPVILCYKKIK
jgi:hypothetical protein